MTMNNPGNYPQGNNTPGSYPPGMNPAPVPVRKSSSSCLIGGLIGCGVLVVIVIIIGGVAVKNFSKSGAMKNMMDSATALQPVANTLAPVATALDSYVSDHKGAYPNSLNDLVPKYIKDKSELSFTMNGTVIPMVYYKPAADAPGYTPVVSVHTGTIPIMSVQKQEWFVALLKDGTVGQEQITITKGIGGNGSR